MFYERSQRDLMWNPPTQLGGDQASNLRYHIIWNAPKEIGPVSEIFNKTEFKIIILFPPQPPQAAVVNYTLMAVNSDNIRGAITKGNITLEKRGKTYS